MRSVDVLESAAGRSPGPATLSPKPFDQVLVTLTKREHIELRIQVKQWKSLHERAIARLELAEKRHQFELALVRQREELLKIELDKALAQIRDLRQRLFGSKTEQSIAVNAGTRPKDGPARPRGQQRGRPGHGRTRLPQLPAKMEGLTSQACCPRCGVGLREFPGTQSPTGSPDQGHLAVPAAPRLLNGLARVAVLRDDRMFTRVRQLNA